MKVYDLIVLGGGAAGIFAAITAKSHKPSLSVLVLEKSAVLLSKVRISGGGRCNVTHHCFDPKELVKNYPRGSRELLGPFHLFGPTETIEWFESRGAELKTEKDGRMFPITDSSETIIETLLSEANNQQVEIRTKQRVEGVEKADGVFHLKMKGGEELLANNLILATGSHNQGHEFASHLGHTLEQKVPSLFTFNVPSSPLRSLSGISVTEAKVSLSKSSLSQIGPLLITHFGFSGPAVLKLSAFAAKELFARDYRTQITINWIPDQKQGALQELKEFAPNKTLFSANPFTLPKNLWKSLIAPIPPEKKLRDISLKQLRSLEEKLVRDPYLVEGKTTHKEEFVTCGGVCLKEVHFSTMESKKCPGLFFAGEILDVDAVTGGFNFQNAWTTGYLAGLSFSSS